MERLRNPTQRSSKSREKGVQTWLRFKALTTFCTPPRFAAERTVMTHSRVENEAEFRDMLTPPQPLFSQNEKSLSPS
ncbi:hypothetical protein [Brevibacillus migulae]|uniref:hypothetical protein n=1 Tax=Brevibacillus migulae TaxID=1644114 RepID=UPI00106EDCCB|nr:hypothetical protein [Brevibacillus migulae]